MALAMTRLVLIGPPGAETADLNRGCPARVLPTSYERDVAPAATASNLCSFREGFSARAPVSASCPPFLRVVGSAGRAETLPECRSRSM